MKVRDSCDELADDSHKAEAVFDYIISLTDCVNGICESS